MKATKTTLTTKVCKTKEPYRISFYQSGNAIYYIHTDKTISNAEERIKNFGWTLANVPMTKDDYKMLKSMFDLNKVYEERIVAFSKNRGQRPIGC